MVSRETDATGLNGTEWNGMERDASIRGDDRMTQN